MTTKAGPASIQPSRRSARDRSDSPGAAVGCAGGLLRRPFGRGAHSSSSLASTAVISVGRLVGRVCGVTEPGGW